MSNPQQWPQILFGAPTKLLEQPLLQVALEQRT
jgi:hypothetical protein